MNKTVVIQSKQAEFNEKDVMIQTEKLHVYVPKTKFKGGSIKFFDDSQLLKGDANKAVSDKVHS
ncbi:hypothetical protein [Frisingicoccus sp.]|uniref:hypothetical protein n=1 Tax=Frisingicoccus sp. TaxID=1918627 RepID=UPI003AB41E00